MYKKPRVIAEVGCNHMGKMDIAYEMIKTAAIFCKVDIVKFQKRNNKELLTSEQYNAPHMNPNNAYGDTYGKHREYLEFTVEQHRQLKEYCDELNIIYSTSVWDLTSAKEIASINPDLIKIPSACNNHYKMLEWLCDNYKGEIHVSLGMTTGEEEKELVELFEKKNRNRDLVLYSCTSGYPVPAEDVCLLEIKRLKDKYAHRVKEIGFSGHHNGIAIDTAAFVLGATVIERHYTLDRTWKGTDHAASLEPDGLRRLNRNMHETYLALQYKKEELLEIELEQREKLKYRKKKMKMLLTDNDGVLTDAGMYYSENGDELKKFNTRDGMAFQMLQERGIITGIITGEDRELVKTRADKLKLNELHMGIKDKLTIVKQLSEKYNIPLEEIVYVGDDINDVEVIKAVGFGCSVDDGMEAAKNIANYVTNAKGGQGTIREVVEKLIDNGMI